MTARTLNSDPRFALASLGAREVYKLLRKLRDEHDAVGAVEGHTLAASLGAVLAVPAAAVEAHIEELATLALVLVCDDVAQLLPRQGARARTGGGAPRVAMTPAEKQQAYRARLAAKAGVTKGNGPRNTVTLSNAAVEGAGVTKGNGVTGNASGNECASAVTPAQVAAENSGEMRVTDGNGPGNATVTDGNAAIENDAMGSPPSPPVSSPSSSPLHPPSSSPLFSPSSSATSKNNSASAREQADAGAEGGAAALALALAAPLTAAQQKAADKAKRAAEREAARLTKAAEADRKAAERLAKRLAGPPDREPEPGSVAARLRDVIVADAVLAPVTPRPGDFSIRAAHPEMYPHVDVVREARRCAAHFAKPGARKVRDGAGTLANWFERAARDAAALRGTAPVQPLTAPAAPPPEPEPVKKVVSPERLAQWRQEQAARTKAAIEKNPAAAGNVFQPREGTTNR